MKPWLGGIDTEVLGDSECCFIYFYYLNAGDTRKIEKNEKALDLHRRQRVKPCSSK